MRGAKGEYGSQTHPSTPRPSLTAAGDPYAPLERHGLRCMRITAPRVQGEMSTHATLRAQSKSRSETEHWPVHRKAPHTPLIGARWDSNTWGRALTGPVAVWLPGGLLVPRRVSGLQGWPDHTALGAVLQRTPAPTWSVSAWAVRSIGAQVCDLQGLRPPAPPGTP